MPLKKQERFRRFARRSSSTRQVRKSLETDDKKIAVKIYQRVLGEIASGEWDSLPTGGGKTLADLSETYLSEHSKPNKSQKSYIRDRGILSKILTMLGETTLLSTISGETVAHINRDRRAAGISAGTINSEIGKGCVASLLPRAFRLSRALCLDRGVSGNIGRPGMRGDFRHRDRPARRGSPTP